MAGHTYLFQLNVTRDCNLRCSHCYIHSDVKKASGQMRATDFLSMIEGLAALVARSPTHTHAEIHVIGGEPTMLGLAFFQEVIPQARALLAGSGISYDLCLVSNLLHPDIAAIAQLFDRINTSWEPDTRFPKPALERRWLENVQGLQNLGVDIGVTTAITRPVIRMGAARILDQMYKNGLKKVHFGFFIPSGDGRVHRDLLMPAFKETSDFLIEATTWYMAHREADPDVFINPAESMLAAIVSGESLDDIVCPIISGSMDIDWDGNAATCLEAGGELDAAWLGNVLETSVAEVAAGAAFKKAVVAAARQHPGCVGCPEYRVCRSGCGVNAKLWDPEVDEDCPGFRKFIVHLRGLVASGVTPRYAAYRSKVAF